jgi:hypothetical protein
VLSESNGLTVLPVRTSKDVDNFVRVPWRVYANDPAWVPPLLVERKGSLAPTEPFFRHAQWQGFIAWRGGEAVGRISAQIDQLYLQRYPDRSGCFGMLDAIDDAAVFAALFAAAEGWLREKGMERSVGPFNLGINQEVGLLVEGYETPPYFLMGHARPYFHDHVRALGYHGTQDMLAYLLPTRYQDDPRIAKLRQRLARKVSIRTLDRRRKHGELEVLRDIFNDAWSENWGFVPFTREEFAAIGSLLLVLLPKDFVLIAEVAGKPVGFIVLVPNLNEVIGDLNGRLFPFGWAKLLWRLKVKFPTTARVPLMGVRKQLHNTPLGPGIATMLIEELGQSAGRAGVHTNELSWILDTNEGMRGIIERIGGKISKRYRMYEKAL